ncbi:hypothetical protein EPA93_01940 [Ktedonosporobacter rubrisoli]|uniref:DUF4199 domain-containing protein n=1 Tax=Ktedonosporobacter rubrisoli TaxID=2509675 RepID=A0A4P6JIT2_KTERU|nr:hypothetical protein [Ktedonosporobacter rubrisoli]QBD74820.1 hypothetical protein EPA93_01940 [Ktedonosporobacter rubrisoli]
MRKGTNIRWQSFVAACIVFVILEMLSFVGLDKAFTALSVFGGAPNNSLGTVMVMFFQPSHLEWLILQMLIAGIVYFVVGWLAARRSGDKQIGLSTGLWAGIFFGIISTIVSIGQSLWTFIPMLSWLSGPQMSNAADLRSFYITFELALLVSNILASFLLVGLLAGAGAGLLGGIVGLRFALSSKTS